MSQEIIEERVRTRARRVGLEGGGRSWGVLGKASSRYSRAARDWVIVVAGWLGCSIMRVGTVAEGFTVVFWVLDCSPLSRLIGIEVYGMDLRARAMRRRAEQEERK